MGLELAKQPANTTTAVASTDRSTNLGEILSSNLNPVLQWFEKCNPAYWNLRVKEFFPFTEVWYHARISALGKVKNRKVFGFVMVR